MTQIDDVFAYCHIKGIEENYKQAVNRATLVAEQGHVTLEYKLNGAYYFG